jgi:hypothetical protein
VSLHSETKKEKGRINASNEAIHSVKIILTFPPGPVVCSDSRKRTPRSGVSPATGCNRAHIWSFLGDIVGISFLEV